MRGGDGWLALDSREKTLPRCNGWSSRPKNTGIEARIAYKPGRMTNVGDVMPRPLYFYLCRCSCSQPGNSLLVPSAVLSCFMSVLTLSLSPPYPSAVFNMHSHRDKNLLSAKISTRSQTS